MGYVADEAVLVSNTLWDKREQQVEMDGQRMTTVADVLAFRDSMPDEYQPLLIGPIPRLVNGGVTFLFAPDGSKEGWGLSNEVKEWRARFLALFTARYSDGSTHHNVIHVRWGHDAGSEEGAAIKYANDEHHDPEILRERDAVC